MHRSSVHLRTNMNDHAFAVGIGDLEVTQFGSAQTGCVQHHQHGAVHLWFGPRRSGERRKYFAKS